MTKLKWWRPVRKGRELAEQARAEAAKTHEELIVPLRKMRSGDYLAPAIAEEIRKQQRAG